VQYAFPDADTCLQVLRDWRQFNLYFVETPLAADDFEGLHRVATEQDIPVATGEWWSTRFEFAPLIERGSIQVAQPEIGRVDGLTEALRVAKMADRRGLRVIPHLWNTGISVAAGAHFAAVTPNGPFVESLPPDLSESPLRKELLTTELEIVDGLLPLPTRPGLGIDLNRDALERFSEAARALYQRNRNGART
jgi:L-alanine-DL-glutamate epimerase-like enolase superfamily enzyme